MSPLIVPLDTVRSSTLMKSTRAIPATMKMSSRAMYPLLVQGKHIELPRTRLRLDGHPFHKEYQHD